MTKRRPDGLPKTIKIARQVHYCAKCGTLIKKGDKMTVRRPDSFGLACLKCDGRYPEWVKAEGQDNPIGDDSLALSGGARHRRRLSVDFGLILHLREVENFGWYSVAREYTKRTGQDISTETCRRRYHEAKGGRVARVQNSQTTFIEPIKWELKVNIDVGHLSREATAEDLRRAFEHFGQVADAKVITDRVTGISSGFGFVEMSKEAEAHAAINGLDSKELKEQRILVNKTRPRGWRYYLS